MASAAPSEVRGGLSAARSRDVFSHEETVEDEAPRSDFGLLLFFLMVLAVLATGTIAAFSLVVGGLAVQSGAPLGVHVPTPGRPVLEVSGARAEVVMTLTPATTPTLLPTSTVVPPSPTETPPPTATEEPAPTPTATPTPIPTPLPTPREVPEPPPRIVARAEVLPGHRAIVVGPGESLSSIAATTGIRVSVIAAANGLRSDAGLLAGQTLIVPGESGVVHVVAAGESLSAIADAYGIGVDTLVRVNGLASAERVLAGQRLVIPG